MAATVSASLVEGTVEGTAILRTGAKGPLPRASGVRAVVLDWAGTIVDFGSCAPVAAFVEAFAAHGVAVTLDQARVPMGMAKREHIAAVASMPEIASAWRARHGRGFDDRDIDAIYATFLPIQESGVERFSAPIPGASEAIAALRQRGVKIGSSTGYTSEIMERVMRIAGAQGLSVDVMQCASDDPQGRPAPWMIFENMRRLGVYPPAAVVTVDDTTVGMESGVNAGTWAVGIAATGNLVGLDEASFDRLDPASRARRIEHARQKLIAAGAHVVIDRVADLPSAVAMIEREMAARV
jgi:phosphonoacetaldehyde hydrolase